MSFLISASAALGGNQVVLSEDVIAEKHANRIGKKSGRSSIRNTPTSSKSTPAIPSATSATSATSANSGPDMLPLSTNFEIEESVPARTRVGSRVGRIGRVVMRKSGLGKLFGMADVAPAESVAAEELQDVEMVRREKRGMILPFQPLSLTFHNMNYFVDMPKVS